MTALDSSDDIFTTQNSVSVTIQSSCEDESLLDVPGDHFDGLDRKETVTEPFKDVRVMWSADSSNEVGETSKKVSVSQRGIIIVTLGEVEERNRVQIPQNPRKSTAWLTRVWDK